MPKAVDVVPRAWSEVIILFDNGWYSVMWGRFRDQSHKDLGVRWNGGDGEVGYPNGRGYPQWYVEPHFLHEGILLSLQQRILSEKEEPQNGLYLRNIETALNETKRQRIGV